MQRNERNVNSEEKVGGLEGEFQMSFKEEAEQCKGQDVRSKDQANTVDGEKEGIKKCLTNEVKSSGVSSTLPTETSESKENENDAINMSDKNNSRQVENKQFSQTKKDDQKRSRSPRTTSSRRPRESHKPLDEKILGNHTVLSLQELNRHKELREGMKLSGERIYPFQRKINLRIKVIRIFKEKRKERP